MNPLSAINAYVQPNGLITLLPKPAQSGAIPATELQNLSPTSAPAVVTETKPAQESFASMLGQLVSDVNAKQATASAAVNGLLSGENVSLHQAMISMQEANTSFQLMVQVRNKLLDSYQELMRMQI
jgi:flagellar hook-basal body complex protein FliE